MVLILDNQRHSCVQMDFSVALSPSVTADRDPVLDFARGTQSKSHGDPLFSAKLLLYE
ncbi:MAG: hypothetical protein Q6K80_11040 [Thermostichus sp. DG_1_6_bins_120]